MEIYLKEQNFAEQMKTEVLPYLRERRRDGIFSGWDGKPLHFARFSADQPRGTIVLLHGYTESIEKYGELIYVFLRNGWNVQAYDQRGHGVSYRAVKPNFLTHVGCFQEYVDDFALFVQQAAADQEMPYVLFAHSMGGAVAALYLERGASIFQRAILNSPMIAPNRKGLPLWVAKRICQTAIERGYGEKRLFTSAPYTGRERFAHSCAGSRARFDYYEEFRFHHQEYQNAAPTYRWTLEALCVTQAILAPGQPEKIAIPLRLYSAGRDHTVERKSQKKWIQRVPKGEFYSVLKAKHEIFQSEDAVLYPYLDSVLSFLNQARKE